MAEVMAHYPHTARQYEQLDALLKEDPAFKKMRDFLRSNPLDKAFAYEYHKKKFQEAVYKAATMGAYVDIANSYLQDETNLNYTIGTSEALIEMATQYGVKSILNNTKYILASALTYSDLKDDVKRAVHLFDEVKKAKCEYYDVKIHNQAKDKLKNLK